MENIYKSPILKSLEVVANLSATLGTYWKGRLYDNDGTLCEAELTHYTLDELLGDILYASKDPANNTMPKGL
jgi:hypothetical protein